MNQLKILGCLLILLSSIGASAAEVVTAGHVLKGSSQYEANLRASGLPVAPARKG